MLRSASSRRLASLETGELEAKSDINAGPKAGNQATWRPRAMAEFRDGPQVRSHADIAKRLAHWWCHGNVHPTLPWLKPLLVGVNTSICESVFAWVRHYAGALHTMSMSILSWGDVGFLLIQISMTRR